MDHPRRYPIRETTDLKRSETKEEILTLETPGTIKVRKFREAIRHLEIFSFLRSND